MPAPWTWLPRRIEALDPETEYDEVMRLLAEHQLTLPIVNLTLLVTTAQTAVPPTAAATLVGTGKLLHRGEQRFADGSAYLLTWFRHGSSSAQTRASVERLNRYHLGLARQFPGAFGDNDEYVYTLCAIGTFLPRMRETLGLPPQSPVLDVAWHHFLRDLGALFRGEHGPVTGLPDDLAGMRRFAEEFEARPWPATDEGHELARGMVQQYADRFFPPPMHWFARTQALLLMPPRVRELHRTGEPGPVAGAVVRVLMRWVVRAQESWWPSRRRAFSAYVESPRGRAARRRREARMEKVYRRRLRRGEVAPPVRLHG
ncbi:hypothetical protein ASG49_09425 [Marmoricola sp. Leaf446]|uniref:hypothetical protein n=1 Tax=Marmoricola sp. Leaf446 TaxID=1736379 RepID=UPI0006FC75EB|nr:hypothetical protein [Marmoricola sp. Leaf446]KQT92161.1 hypothetical protein ASG49_09425 [Marmoricola sp. Leaf446]